MVVDTGSALRAPMHPVRRTRLLVVPFALLAIAVVSRGLVAASSNGGSTVSVWLTTPDQANLLTPQAPVSFGPDGGTNPFTIDLDESTTYQQMDGFGASFTDSAAWLVANALSSSARTQLLARLFDATTGIGLSYLRQPMGATDFALSNYTYDDVPAGQTDPTLAQFSIQHDSAYIIPVIQQALQVNPSLRVMATPWTAPAWMKTNQSLFGGSLKADSITMTAYANYFVKFIQQYTAAGIPIHRITTQNEPLNTSSTFPTLYMDATQQATFIGSYLAPALAGAGLSTQIAAYDHNWDNESYPDSILASPAGASVSGSAWHCYAGTPAAMTDVHALFPTKDIYFTECSAGEWSTSFANNLQWDMQNLMIGAPLNWARTITKWNVALDQNDGPQNGGCSNCRGLVTIDRSVSPAAVTFNVDYYSLGHISQFVRPGAHRIAATTFGAGSIVDVVFLNPDGGRAVVTINGDTTAHTIKVRRGTESFSYYLAAGAAATFTWAAPSVTMTAPTQGATYAAPASIAVSANPSSDAGIRQVQFFSASTLIGTATDAPYTATWTTVAAGTYMLTAVETDNAGQTATSAPVQVTVNVDAPPTVAIVS